MTISTSWRMVIAVCMVLSAPVQAVAGSHSVYLEELTWQEIRDKIRTGTYSVIVPTGGLEQGGPHLVTGKQNTVVRYTAGQIAKSVNALVAPVLAYVPEGRIDPPDGHMQFPGTISISEQAFGMVLEDTARSLKQHGFRYIFFVGEHSGSQRAQQQVADKLSSMWHSEGARVINVSHYFSRNGQEEWSQSAGIRVPMPHAHAGHIETSELMALDPGGVRDNLRAAYSERDYKATGAMGDSTQASAKYGRRYIGLKQEAGDKTDKTCTLHGLIIRPARSRM